MDALRDAVLASLPRPEDAARPELARYYRLLRDYPQRSGKSLRGQLLLHACEAHGGDWRAALPVAAGLELFQNWVLVHDDIEDGSEERRGGPALHRLVGMPLALNAGDGLHVYMWERLLGTELPRREEVLREFLTTIHRTAEGQHLDLAWVEGGRFDVQEDEYLEMVALKTARYTVVAPLRLGALCAGSDPHPALERAGVDLGVAFQIRDDVLNLMPEMATGKEFAGDLYEGKRTLVLAHLFAHAGAAEREEARALLARPREEKTPADVQRLLELIARHGSLVYAQEVADARAARGLGELRGALAPLPGRASARELVALVESLATRLQ